MPLPDDERVIALANSLLAQFDAIFGQHPGFRPAHAKGAMLEGAFIPSEAAKSLSRAPHFRRESTPVTVRFSNSTGVPMIPDNDANANPRGIGIRFHLAERVHTDIVAHSTDGFPTHTGNEFLEFLKALASTDFSKPSPNPFEQFLGSHPAALAFVQTPKPAPSSFARESYFGVTAMKFSNEAWAARFGRYQILPVAGNEHLSAEEVATKPANYLLDELQERIQAGQIKYRLMVQLAEDGDEVNDATIHWPADRELLDLGTIVLTGPVANDAAEQQHIIFDPIPRVDGIEPSEDPLLELRAAIYLLSGRRRRAAAPVAGN